jgi:hypothetical protein
MDSPSDSGVLFRIHVAGRCNINLKSTCDSPAAPSGLMQPVHVLGEQHSAMRVVGDGLPEVTPSARQFVGHERLEADRLSSFPIAVGVTVIGDTRVGAAAGAGQDKQPPMAFDEGLERLGFHVVLIYFVPPVLPA